MNFSSSILAKALKNPENRPSPRPSLLFRLVPSCFVLVSFAVPSVDVLAAGGVEKIALDWVPTGRRRLPVISAAASSFYGPAEGQYAPGRASDGNRRSKWVASIAPRPSAPQWLTLTLLGSQEISAVAVFGEATNNDGIIDAQVQVAGTTPGQFTTVAEIRNAQSPAWLTSFKPVKTKAVRLLVTRSGGPSPHTDVFEVEVYGIPLSGPELQAYATERLTACHLPLAKAITGLAGLNVALKEAQGVSVAVDQLHRQVQGLTEQLHRWNILSESERQRLVEQAERLEMKVRPLADRLEKAAAIWPPRLQDLMMVRRRAKELVKDNQVATARVGNCLLFGTPRHLVSLDEKDGTWSVTWLEGVPAAIRGVRFFLEINGQTLRPEGIGAKATSFTDKLGSGPEICQCWGNEVFLERTLRVYRNRPAVVVACRISNRSNRDVILGTVRLVDLSAEDRGWWYAGSCLESPGAVFVNGLSELLCEPWSDAEGPIDAGREYAGTGVITLASREPRAGLTLGFLTAFEARPDLYARFQTAAAGTALRAEQRFLGRKLKPGRTLELDPVYLSAHADPYEALEAYGDSAAAMCPQPIRKGANSLWCSWYAHRMAMTEELVLANAAIAAQHFLPLGLDLIQLDHGWQRGDITGDWLPNERFPHGLRWLADQLRRRHGMKLGVWISPTDVAETSETFRRHPDWLLKDGQGKPLMNWQWYWKPNPNCFELDASHPGAAKFIEETFARLTAEGVSYYKIDFIAPSGGEHFGHHDPTVTRGWGVLRAAMEAIRRGAGPQAWIRYCQTPPLLSAGLANSAYGGNDTADAGLPGWIDLLRTNARSLAAGYWLNDRLYHREVCDMSVRLLAPVEEVRLRLALMTLAGCSISFSDEFQFLPPSRIQLMQKCLPPGSPPMKPLDLFERTIPSIWHIPCKTPADQWDVVGLFNFEDRPEERTVDLGRLGLAREVQAVVFEFWEEKLLGLFKERLTLVLPPQTSRILFIRRSTGKPQVVGTDMHLLGGYHELPRLAWDEAKQVLSLECRRAPGLPGRVFVHVPPGYVPHVDFPLNPASARLTNIGDGLWVQEVQFKDARRSLSIPFDKEAPK